MKELDASSYTTSRGTTRDGSLLDELGYLPFAQAGGQLFAVAPRAYTDGATMGNSRTHGDSVAHAT